MNLRTVVIIATKGRPQDLTNLLETLALQTVPPDRIVVSACDHTDIEQGCLAAKNVEALFGAPGLPVQRNRALSSVRGKYDIIIFFDDDFVPSRFWIERVKILLDSQPEVVSVTGKLLADGVTFGGLQRPDGQSMVDRADLSKETATPDSYTIQDHRSAYGCNMAFRAKSIEHLTFDERLVLYGWLEDRDFSFRAGPRMVWTDAVWGVHLGTTRGRSSGLSFGYSQVVNPRYLVKKGTMSFVDACRTICRALAGNAIGSFFPSSLIDRRGRLRGNMMAVKDIVCGRWAPERAADL
jgi:glycosyltransferase involved in cell wall biosynthesis